MVHQRIGDYEQFQAYMTAVFRRTEEWLDGLDPAELTRVVIGRPFPPQVASTYSARVAGPEGITLLGCHRVLDLPARAAPHGGDRVGPGPGGPGGHDLLTGRRPAGVDRSGRATTAARGRPCRVGRGRWVEDGLVRAATFSRSAWRRWRSAGVHRCGRSTRCPPGAWACRPNRVDQAVLPDRVVEHRDGGDENGRNHERHHDDEQCHLRVKQWVGGSACLLRPPTVRSPPVSPTGSDRSVS